MSRLFFSLFIILLLVVVSFMLSANGVVKYLFGGVLEGMREQQTGGIFILLDDEIRGLDETQRQQRLAEIEKLFIYEASLQPIKQLELTEQEQQALRDGQFINKVHDQAEHSYHRSYLEGLDDMAWRLQLESTLTQDDHDFLTGPIALVEQRLINTPRPQWAQTVADNARHFGIVIQLRSLPQVKDSQLLDATQLEKLHAGDIAMRFKGRNLEYAFKRMGDSDQVLQIGPIIVPWILNNIRYPVIIALVLLVGVAIWLWLRPVWQDLRRLRKAAEGFGQAELNTRIEIPRYSFIKSILEAFNHMASRIEQLIASHRTLTNAVSHELRTPVARLRFSLEMLAQASSESDRQRHLQSMNTDIDELDEMLADLLTYARMDRQHIQLNKTAVIPYQWLQEQLQRQQQMPMDKALHIRGDCQKLPASAVRMMDDKLMAHALHNLLQNACRYARQEIRVSFTQDASEYVLQVEDDGCGIPESHYATLFDPFTRVDSSRDRHSGGYGLGLALVKQIMQMHQGSAEVSQSALGGAQFVLRWRG